MFLCGVIKTNAGLVLGIYFSSLKDSAYEQMTQSHGEAGRALQGQPGPGLEEKPGI